MFITTPRLRYADDIDGEGATPTPSDMPKKPESVLGEGGIKALQAERDARAAAEKRAAELQKQIDAAEAEKLSDLERAQKAAEDAVKKANDAEARSLRWRFALDNGVPAAWVDRLRGDTEDDLAADWAELQPTLAAPVTPKGAVVPEAGRQPTSAPSLPEQIRAAESEGNRDLAMSLKAQQLAELRNRN